MSDADKNDKLHQSQSLRSDPLGISLVPMLLRNHDLLHPAGVRFEPLEIEVPAIWSLGARLILGLEQLKEREPWTPRGHLFAAVFAMSHSLSFTCHTRTGSYLAAVHNDPGFKRIRNSIVSRRDRQVMGMIEMLSERRVLETCGLEDDIGYRLCDLLFAKRNEEHTNPCASEATYYALVWLGLQVAQEMEEVPPLDQPMDLVRGRGVASNLRICDQLSEEAYYLYAELADELTGIEDPDLARDGAYEAVRSLGEPHLLTMLVPTRLYSQEADMVLRSGRLSDVDAAALLLAERWANLLRKPEWPWGDPAPAVVPDPRRLYSAAYL